MYVLASAQQETVTIGAIVPQNSFLRRKYLTALNMGIRYYGMREGRDSILLKKYKLKPLLIEMERWSPPEILDALSEKVGNRKSYLCDVYIVCRST